MKGKRKLTPPRKSTRTARVLAEQRAVEARLTALNRESPVHERGRFSADNTPTAEFAESVQERIAREMEFASRGILVTRLRGLTRARQKLREGTYGVCDACGGPIPPRRLQALPEASLCVPCAKQNEQDTRPGPAAGHLSATLRR
jgi:RNA polymerase-binding transcription factor DksA